MHLVICTANITSCSFIIDHPQSGVVYNFGCVYVYLSDDNFRKPWRKKFIFARLLYLQGIRVRFTMQVIWSRSQEQESKKNPC